VDSRVDLYVLEKRTYRALVGIRTPNHPARTVVAIPTVPPGVQVSVLVTKFVFFIYDVGN